MSSTIIHFNKVCVELKAFFHLPMFPILTTFIWYNDYEFSAGTSVLHFPSCFYIELFTRIHFCFGIVTDDAINVVYLKQNRLPKATLRSPDFYDADFYSRYEIVNGLLWWDDINSAINFLKISAVIKKQQCTNENLWLKQRGNVEGSRLSE